VAVVVASKSVDDFIQSAVAAAGNYQAAAFGSGAMGDFCGMSRAGGFRELGFDAASGKNMARRLEREPAFAAASAGVGVVNQQSVSQISGHQWPGASPFVLQDIHSI
jgi:hypothetical protein